jgi:hypothetical protein
MVATHDTSVAQTPSLLGRARGPLRLRIVEDAHSSEQVVTLSAAKCTVGSDQRCTLRLDLPGIESVYCLILRGKRCDVVRSWAGHTLLNGRSFQDARLNSGDLLRLGTVNVEVLPDPEIDRQPDDEHQAAIEPGVVEPAEAALPKSTVATIPNPVNEQLVIELLATRQEINELPAQVQTSADELRRAVEESECRAEHREEWETERQSWRQQQAEWDAEREGWEVQQLEWQDRESDWNEQRCQVEQQADEWVRQKESWENQHSEWQQRQSEWEAERAEWERRIQQLEEGQAAVSDESPISDPDSADWDQEEEDQVSQKIQQRLQAQRDTLDREKAAAQADKVNAESLADDQIAKLERQAALLAEHLTTRGKDNHVEARSDETRFEEASSEEASSEEDALHPSSADPAGPVLESPPVGAESSPHVDSFPFSSADEQSLDAEPSLPDAEPPLTLADVGLTAAEPLLPDAEPQLPELGDYPVDDDPVSPLGSIGLGEDLRDDADASERLDPYARIPADPIAALGEEEMSIDPVAELLAAAHRPADVYGGEFGLPEPIEPFVAEPPSEAWSVESAATSEEIEEPPFQEVTEAAPTIAADILARMGEMPDWDGDPVEPTLARDEVPPANEMFSSPAEIAPRDIGMAQPGPGGDDDESIEDYMARLLQRVSGDDDSPAVSAPSTGIESVPSSAAPTSAVENAIPEPIQAEPGPQQEYVPRAQAPEQAGKLEAMREVANMSARSAINTHTRMRGGKASHLRLDVALIAMVVGGVLQWMSSTTNPGFGQVGLAIIVLGIFWGCQAMLISRACLSDTQRPDAGIAGAGTGNDDNGNLFTDEG